jgi:hypothetical protein
VFCDAAIDFVAGLHHLARDGVGFKDMEAVFAEDGGDGSFATTEAAGESYTQHTSPIDTLRRNKDGISDVIVRRAGAANGKRRRNVYRLGGTNQ